MYSFTLVLALLAAAATASNPAGGGGVRMAHDLVRAKTSSNKRSQSKGSSWEEAVASTGAATECETICTDYDWTTVDEELDSISDGIDDSLNEVIASLEARYFVAKKLDAQLQPLHDAIVEKAAELSQQEQAVAVAHNQKLAELNEQVRVKKAQQAAAFVETEEEDADYGSVRIESATFITSIALVSGMAATNLAFGSFRSRA